MNRELAKDYVKAELETYLKHKGINTRKPFRCLNPEHSDYNPSMSFDKNRNKCHCFSCGADYDIFDLVSLEYGLTDHSQVFSKTYELFNISLESDYRNRIPETQKQSEIGQKKQHAIYNDIYTNSREKTAEYDGPISNTDFSAEVEAAHNELLSNDEALSYLKSRGLTKTITEYKLGYHAQGYNDFLKAYPQHHTRGQKESLYRYIFPYFDNTGKVTYFLSEIADRNQTDSYNGKYRKISKGNTGLVAQVFNERYLQEPVPSVIFVCEGIYDALSIEEVGGKAIAFAGTAHNRFLELCEKYRPDTTFVIALDNDQAGQQCTEKLKTGLQKLNIAYEVKTSKIGKDENEALQADRDVFSEYVYETMGDIEKAKKRAKEEAIEAYLKTSTAYKLQNFIDDIEKSKNANFYPTGFRGIDKLLDGGLYAGLYCIGAISSLGKTTLCLQIVDQIAQNGQDVLIFSLEMARSELIAKSVSRHTLLEDLKQNGKTVHAKTTRGIITGSRYSSYSPKDKEIISAAVASYAQYAQHIFIHEGVGNIGVQQIRNIVEQHVKITQSVPVVLVDYLQILAPHSERATDKQNTDKSVLELKRLSRDYNTPIIGISSFNRENYTSPVNMTSFKESGAVEYSSDVLLALQYEGMDWLEGETERDRNRRVREIMNNAISNGKQGKSISIQVKILKNRNGSKGDVYLDFYPMFNYFAEKKKSPALSEGWTVISSTEENPFV